MSHNYNDIQDEINERKEREYNEAKLLSEEQRAAIVLTGKIKLAETRIKIEQELLEKYKKNLSSLNSKGIKGKQHLDSIIGEQLYFSGQTANYIKYGKK